MLIITGSSQKTLSNSSSTPDKHGGGAVSINQEVGK